MKKWRAVRAISAAEQRQAGRGSYDR
jgi:hypothetical protein